jgi:NADH-quinone oxidoreductase subunit M
MNQSTLLILITLLPLVGMLAVLALPKNALTAIRGTSLLVTGVQLVLSLVLWAAFNPSLGGINDPKSFQFVTKATWLDLNTSFLGNIHIDFYMGIDGLSMPMIVLTAIVMIIATVSSWSISKNQKGYFALLLLLNTGVMGTFVSLDFFLFYVFWELMLLPMYFLIGIWGGPRREYAAIKFFLYTLSGSVFMLLAIIGLYYSSNVTPGGAQVTHTFDMLALMNPAHYIQGGILSPSNVGSFGATTLRFWGFIALFIGFAIKVPMFPFHTWLPDAHVEAPTAISVVLAGVLLKLGTYGMMRICFSMFPDVAMTPMIMEGIAVFGFIGIVYGALCAMAQKDMKKLIAYSSVSHMGYVLLGLASMNTIGFSGAVFQMFNHGTITAMLFLLVGVVYDRVHDRTIAKFGGLANIMPGYFFIVMIAFFAALGLPGLSGWWSESFVFIGAFRNDTVRFWTILSLAGVVLGAAYMLWLLQRVFLGTLKTREWESHLPDLNKREWAMLVPLTLIVVALGVWPAPVLGMMNGSMNALVNFLQSHSGTVTNAMNMLPK